MQYVILTLALVSVPVAQHQLESREIFQPFFAGEKALILSYCQEDLPVVYSTYPGPGLLPEKTVTTCIPKHGNRAVHIICIGVYTCLVMESQTPATTLAGLIKEWQTTKKRP